MYLDYNLIQNGRYDCDYIIQKDGKEYKITYDMIKDKEMGNMTYDEFVNEVEKSDNGRGKNRGEIGR